MSQISVDQALQLALQHHQAGRLAEAEALYRKILEQFPNHPAVLHQLGILAGQTGHSGDAVAFLTRAVALSPEDLSYCFNLGIALRQEGRFEESIAAYREVLLRKQDFPEAWFNLGFAYKAANRLPESIDAYRKAVQLRPAYPEAWFNLANSEQAAGRLDDAIASHRQTLRLKPNLAEGHCNLGAALAIRGDLIEAATAFQRALALKPDYTDAHTNLSTVINAQSTKLLKSGHDDQAYALLVEALAITPTLPEAHNNLAFLHKERGKLDAAIQHYRQAVASAPNYASAHSNLVCTLHFHPDYDALAIRRELDVWQERHAAPLARFIPHHTNDRSPDRPLRIGYVSPDFREHCQSLFTLPLFCNHDKKNFQIIAYSSTTNPDDLTHRLKSYTSEWHDTSTFTAENLAQKITADEIDILVDLTMHMANNRLLTFARKPAPIQITWLAYPGSTGLRTIDYRLSDPFIDPPGVEDDGRYAEQTLHLPDTFWCYDPLTQVPLVNELPALSAGGITFGCLNNFCKINHAVLALWAQLMIAVKNSRLLLLAPEGPHRDRVRAHFRAAGIDSDRIHFVGRRPHADYLALYHQIDIGLDTYPYNGHTTSLDSFWMGVPVITLVGKTVVGRAGLSQLTNLGLPELIAHDPAAFVQIAATLAHDLPRLASLRKILRPRMQASPLMDAPRFTRALERIYRDIWRKWCTENSAVGA